MPDPSWNYVAKIQKNLSTIVVSSLNNVNDSQKRFYDAYRHTVSIVQHVIAPEKKLYCCLPSSTKSMETPV